MPVNETEIGEIEKLTEEFAKDRGLLADAVGELEEKINQAKRHYLPIIRKCVRRAASSREELVTAIDGAPSLFAKPKTRIFHGIKVGYRKQKGEIVVEDEPKTIRLIEKLFPGDAYEGIGLLRQKVSVDKAAVAKSLAAADIKRLGITIKEDTDEIVIAPVDGDVERIVEALLKGAEEKEEAAA